MEPIDTKLHEAVRYGDTNLVESALKENLDPNAIGLYQWGPLHEAANNGDLEILWLLLQYKGDPNARDDLHGCTPVHYASKEGHVECLEALLEMGGRYDIANSDGETGLDVAVGKCRELLDQHRMKELINVSVKEKLAKGTEDESKALGDGRPEMLEKDDAELQDNCSPIPSPSPSLKSDLPTAWDAIEVQETNADPLNDAGTGYLQLSFEYNSHTSVMKIRVWKLEDILLPPAEIASITRVSIRSRLLPDKKGETKRKTEDAKLEDLEKLKTSIVSVKRKTSKESFKAIYLPCAFSFTRPLEYKNVTKDMVGAKTVHIDVNVKQKYSSKSFTVANMQLPLKEAVRKLRKRRYRLHPCINYTMPDNIHSYDPNDLIIVAEGMYSNKTVSNPNLRSGSKQSLKVPAEKHRATSDMNLQSVRCHSVDSIPSVSLSIPSDEQEDDTLQAISVMNDSPRSSQLSHSNPEIHVVEIHEMDTFLPGAMDSDLKEVKVEPPRRKISSSSPNIPILKIEDLEGETPPKRLNRPTSPPNRLAVPPVTYNKRRQQSLSKSKQDLPDVQTTSNSDHKQSQRHQEPPRPGRAVPVSVVRESGNTHHKPEMTSFSNPSVVLDTQDHDQLRIKARKEAVKAKAREKRNQRSKEGRHALLRTFSEKEGVDSPVFEQDETRKTGQVEYREVSETTGRPQRLSASQFKTALGQTPASEDQRSSRNRPGDKHSRTALPMTELTLSPSPLPEVRLISETQFSKLSPAQHSTPKKTPSDQRKPPPHPSERHRDKIQAQTFPQPVTQGIPHTKLKRPTSPPNRLSSQEDLQDASRSPSPGSEARVHFLSETTESDRKHKQTSSARRIRSPVRRVDEKTPKKPDREEIEMNALQLDPDFHKEMARPEFKLRMFQRTSRDPHPAELFVKSRSAESEFADSPQDPFFVPGTPTGSPMVPDDAITTNRTTQLRQGELRPVENQSIVRVKQSVL